MNVSYFRFLPFYYWLLFFPANLFTQDYTTVGESTYEHLVVEGHGDVFLLAGNDHMILLSGDSIRKYDDVQRAYATDVFFDREFKGVVVERNGRSYLMNENWELYPEGGLPFNVKSFNGETSRLDRVGNTLVFSSEDGIYRVNIKTGTKKLVMSHGYPMISSERQLWVKTYDDEYFFFHPDRQEVLPFSVEELGYPSWDNDSLIVTRKFNDETTYAVLDFDMKEIISYDRGFTESYIRSDMIILNSRSKSLMLRGPSDTTLLEGVKEVQMTNHPEIFVAFNLNGQKYFIDRYGQQRGERVFNSVYCSILLDGVQAKDKNQTYLFSDSGKLLLSGKYDKIRYLFPNRYVVTKNRRKAVVNEKGEVILPYRFSRLENLIYGNVGPVREPLIFSNPHRDTMVIHNLSGEMLITWNPNTETRFVSERAMQWSYSLSALAAIPDEKAVQLRAVNAWRVSRKVNEKAQYRLIRRNGTPITEWYDHVYSTVVPGLYVIGSGSENYRLIRVKSDYSSE